ncbi:hypothetical protein E2C01_095143 [Portunus trituberculatus]|uniref:Uncharacterized protein n=1 Tax=Portunus trituberculatus TaxID=210409 RepID=A0A5B7JZ81_PORTR|nr:hypothetical protein [Portunus trituberculatus]
MQSDGRVKDVWKKTCRRRRRGKCSSPSYIKMIKTKAGVVSLNTHLKRRKAQVTHYWLLLPYLQRKMTM